MTAVTENVYVHGEMSFLRVRGLDDWTGLHLRSAAANLSRVTAIGYW